MLLGNDIIDLSYPDNLKCFQDHKYLNKFLTTSEFKFINNSKIGWLPQCFWTCKESAYKVMLKKGLRKAFSPGKYNVEIISLSPLISKIKYNDIRLFAYSTYINKKYIHTYASDQQNQNSLWMAIGSSRTELLHITAQKLLLPKNNLSIIKENNIPWLTNGENKLPIDISLSHDGEYHALVMNVNIETVF